MWKRAGNNLFTAPIVLNAGGILYLQEFVQPARDCVRL
jgi:hypothetical protein